MTDIPKADMRGVQFNDGVYSRRVGDLCERCGVYDDCSKSTKQANELDVEVVTSECKDFHPILLFVNPKGTDDEFSTLRLGQAWQKRVVDGSIVSLFDKKRGYYGKAEVKRVHSGLKHFVIYDCRFTNHMMLDYEGKPDDRLAKLNKIVKSAYGNLIWKNNNMATSIDLRRIE